MILAVTPGGDLTSTVTLPVLIPMLNLAFSVGALVAWSVVIWRVLHAPNWRDGYSARFFFGAFLTLLFIITAGAMSQLGILPTPIWVMIGTGGRLVVMLLGIVMAADQELIEASRK